MLWLGIIFLALTCLDIYYRHKTKRKRSNVVFLVIEAAATVTFFTLWLLR
jgi:hypothetical protein